jgi:hypothetical protein
MDIQYELTLISRAYAIWHESASKRSISGTKRAYESGNRNRERGEKSMLFQSLHSRPSRPYSTNGYGDTLLKTTFTTCILAP